MDDTANLSEGQGHGCGASAPVELPENAPRGVPEGPDGEARIAEWSDSSDEGSGYHGSLERYGNEIDFGVSESILTTSILYAKQNVSYRTTLRQLRAKVHRVRRAYGTGIKHEAIAPPVSSDCRDRGAESETCGNVVQPNGTKPVLSVRTEEVLVETVTGMDEVLTRGPAAEPDYSGVPVPTGVSQTPAPCVSSREQEKVTNQESERSWLHFALQQGDATFPRRRG